MKKAATFLAWLAVAAAAIFLALQLSFLARVWWWKDHNPGSTAFMEASLERLRAKKDSWTARKIAAAAAASQPRNVASRLIPGGARATPG